MMARSSSSSSSSARAVVVLVDPRLSDASVDAVRRVVDDFRSRHGTTVDVRLRCPPTRSTACALTPPGGRMRKRDLNDLAEVMALAEDVPTSTMLDVVWVSHRVSNKAPLAEHELHAYALLKDCRARFSRLASYLLTEQSAKDDAVMHWTSLLRSEHWICQTSSGASADQGMRSVGQALTEVMSRVATRGRVLWRGDLAFGSSSGTSTACDAAGGPAQAEFVVPWDGRDDVDLGIPAGAAVNVVGSVPVGALGPLVLDEGSIDFAITVRACPRIQAHLDALAPSQGLLLARITCAGRTVKEVLLCCRSHEPKLFTLLNLTGWHSRLAFLQRMLVGFLSGANAESRPRSDDCEFLQLARNVITKRTWAMQVDASVGVRSRWPEAEFLASDRTNAAASARQEAARKRTRELKKRDEASAGAKKRASTVSTFEQRAKLCWELFNEDGSLRVRGKAEERRAPPTTAEKACNDPRLGDLSPRSKYGTSWQAHRARGRIAASAPPLSGVGGEGDGQRRRGRANVNEAALWKLLTK